jgi:hypothetical protein
LGSSLVPLNSSSSQHCLRVLFAGGGAVGEEDWTGFEGGAVQCGRISGIFETGSVWALVEQVAGLQRFRRRALWWVRSDQLVTVLAAEGLGKRQKRMISSPPAVFLTESHAWSPAATYRL